MRRLQWLAGLAAALSIVVLAFLATRDSPRAESKTAARELAGPSKARKPSQRAMQVEPEPTVKPPMERPTKPTLDAEERQRRAEVREQILAAQRARDAATGETSSAGRPSDPERPPGNLNERTEGPDGLVAALNADFMPLVDECIEEATARDPKLAGTLTIEFVMILDEDLGAMIETVDFPDAEDQVVQAELQECARETLLSTLLPPIGPISERGGLMLTLPVGDED